MSEKTAVIPVEADDPRLSYEIRHLSLTARGMRACRQLGVKTIQDFLKRERRDFTRLRNCGNRTYDDLARRVGDFLSTPGPNAPSSNVELDQPIQGLIDNPRAERAFQTLGITTIGEFMDTPREELLAVKGFGERTYWLIAQRIRQIVESDSLSLLPSTLLGFEVHHLRLDSALTEALERRGIANLEDLLRVPIARLRDVASIGPRGIEDIRQGLDRLLHIGVDRSLDVDSQGPEFDFEGTMAEILAVLEEDQRMLCIQRLGLGGRVRSLSDIADRMGIDLGAARVLEEKTRVAIRDHAPSLVNRVQSEAHRDFRAFDGVIPVGEIATGTLLHRAAVASKDALMPLRLVRFLLAGEFFLYDDVLTTLRPETFRKVQLTIASSCRRQRLPLQVRELTDRLREIVDPVPTGLMMYVLRQRGDVCIQVDPELGDVIQPKQLSTCDRLHELLLELGQPTPLEEIHFAYREVHGQANMNFLLDHLRRDARFLEVGRTIWSLREEHLSELALASDEADAIAEHMTDEGGRRNLLDPRFSTGLSERKLYSIVALLREDPRVRYLGRGVFCVPGEKSEVMEDIRESMRRAMGEIVISRFLDNQPRTRRRLAACLLHENRALVETAPDRIDAMTNYPFNEERLERLFGKVDEFLSAGRGHATAAEVRESVIATDLGGDWLTEHMLLDLLRRHARFELLPGGFIAQESIRLGGWIQRRIRECLRDARRPMSAQQIVSETPELGAFVDGIHQLAEQDPMVFAMDGGFAIV